MSIVDIRGNKLSEPGLKKNIKFIKLQKIFSPTKISRKITKTKKLCTNKSVSKFANLYNIDHRTVLGCENTNDKQCWEKFPSLNDFFIRKRTNLPPDTKDNSYKSYLSESYKQSFNIKPTLKDFEKRLIVSPADCYSIYLKKNDIDNKLWIKGKHFTIEELFEDEKISLNNYDLCIFRLAPHHYHRFHCPVYGKILSMCYTGKDYLSVNPLIVRSNIDVYTKNVRLILKIQLENRDIIYMSIIGATCVGSIIITNKEILNSLGKPNSLNSSELGYKNEIIFKNPPIIKPNDELGYFQFGGSTIVMGIPNTKLNPSYILKLIRNNSMLKTETEIKVGDVLFSL